MSTKQPTYNSLHNSREKLLWTVLIPQMILLTISTLWIYFDSKNYVLQYFKKFNIQILICAIITGIILAILGYVFYKWMKKTKRFYSMVELFEEVLSPSFSNLKQQDVIILSMVSGFSEEIFFRGLLYTHFGISVSSLAFGILHMPGFKFWVYAVWATLSGALFCILLSFSGSLWLPIIAHIINNIIGMFILRKINK